MGGAADGAADGAGWDGGKSVAATCRWASVVSWTVEV